MSHPADEIIHLIKSSQDFVNRLATKLGPHWKQRKQGIAWEDILADIYDVSDVSKEANTFRKFLQNHSMECISIGNSLTFKMTSLDTGEHYVLRLEYAMGHTQQLYPDADKQAALNESGLVTPIHQSSFSTVTLKRKEKSDTHCKVIVMELVDGQNLVRRFKHNLIDAQTRYRQCNEDALHMVEGFLGFLARGIYFPDGKCGNWMRQVDGTLQVADQKSLIQISKANALAQYSIQSVVTSGYFAREMPSMISSSFSASDANKANAFTLGANLYYYLTARDRRTPEGEVIDEEPPIKFRNWPFHADIFKGPIGTRYKQLILRLTAVLPANRMSLEEAKEELLLIRELIAAKDQDRDLDALVQHHDKKPDVMEILNVKANKYLTSNLYFSQKSKKSIPKYYYLNKLREFIENEMPNIFTKDELALFIRSKHDAIMAFVKSKVVRQGKYKIDGTRSRLNGLEHVSYKGNIGIDSDFTDFLCELTGEPFFSPEEEPSRLSADSRLSGPS